MNASWLNRAGVLKLFLYVTILVALVWMLPTRPVYAAGRCYVNGRATGANTGTSWTNAYTDLQSALGSTFCTEIWVAAGTYRPTTGTDRAETFQLKSGVAIYGGFAGNETSRDARDWTANVTTLSGEIGVVGKSDNSYHVVTASETDGNTRLDGFTITAGNVFGFTQPYNRGGGMYNYRSNPTLANLKFTGNQAYNYGGGLYNEQGNPTLTNVTFSGNLSSGNGGGMANLDSNPTLSNVTFSDNVALYGGGMYNLNSITVLTNATFSGNSASGSPGAGGGMRNSGGNATLTNATFSGNSASGSPGAGGGIANTGSITLTNVTFSDNAASAGNGGGLYNTGKLDYFNTIIANSASGGDCNNNGGTIGANINNLVKDGSCSASLSGDPKLGVLADNGGFTQTLALLPASPAIDAGDDGTCPATDQRDVSRPGGAHCDIGAYEYVPTLAPPNVIASDGNYLDKVLLTWSAVSGATSYLVYRSDSPDGVKIPTDGYATTALGGGDIWSAPGVTYFYWVKACDANACSEFSAAETGWRDLTPPLVTASDGAYPDKVQLTWPAVSGATFYLVYRSDSLSGTKIPAYGYFTSAPSGGDFWTVPGVTYYYWVRACNGFNCSALSAYETGWR